VQPESARVIRIRNTLDLKEVLVSEVYQAEMEGPNDVSIIEPAQEIEFDENGDLPLLVSSSGVYWRGNRRIYVCNLLSLMDTVTLEGRC